MIKPLMLLLDLQLFAEEDSGVEDVSAAEIPNEETEVVTESESGANEEVAAEPEKQNNFEKAFAKRLAAERSKWDTEVNEKYKDYDTHKELSQYFQQINGVDDPLTLKEQIELVKLQERAEEQNVPPEVLKRIDELEAKAARGDELEQQQIKEQSDKFYWSSVEKFVDGKDVNKDDLNKYMIDHEIYVDLSNPEQMERKFEMAMNAMNAVKYKEQLATAKETAVKEYLQSKSAPRVEGSGSPGVVHEDTSKMSFKEIEKRAAARIAAANQPT